VADYPLPAGTALGSAAITPSGQYVYFSSSFVSNSGNNVWGFSINSTTGELRSLPAGPFSAGSYGSLTVDPAGKFLYLLNQCLSCGTITAYAIDAATGNLAQLKSVRTRGVAAMAVSAGSGPITYTTKYAYVANNSGNTISAYSVSSATGGLTKVLGSPFAAGSAPTVAADPLGKFLYAVDAGGGAISALTIDQTSGVLSAVPGSPFAGGSLMLPGSMAIDPTGELAYVTNGSPSSNTVAGFAIDRTSGALTTIWSSYITGSAPSRARVESTGRFLYVTNSLSNNVSAFSVDNHYGVITPIAGSPFTVGTDPLGLVIDPTARFVYVANQVSNSVSAFQIDLQTGALSEITGSPYATTGPLALAIDGSGSFLYVANHTAADNISAYSIDPSTGALTLLPSSPFTAGNGPNDIAVDFSGKFLYVANGISNDLSVFSINALNGQLTQVLGSPFAAGSVPGSVVTTGQIQ
jgi:6-phosphogluconolactonase (cycloisomerase 2 family)